MDKRRIRKSLIQVQFFGKTAVKLLPEGPVTGYCFVASL
jgi:hypothetical protein